MKRALLVVLLLVVACSDGDDDDDKAAAPASSPTTTASTSSTTEPSSSTADEVCFSFAEVDRGASVTVYGVFDCDGVPMRLDGADAAFPVGGTVTHAEGMRCEDDHLVVLSAVSDDGETFQATETIYEVRDGELTRSEAAGRTLTAAEVQPYYELDCPAT